MFNFEELDPVYLRACICERRLLYFEGILKVDSMLIEILTEWGRRKAGWGKRLVQKAVEDKKKNLN